MVGSDPLGIAALEDKIVQSAVVEVLNAIYEEDFLGFSYGFRPGRSPHRALDAWATAVTTRKVNWVLDLDVCSYFDRISHEWNANRLLARWFRILFVFSWCSLGIPRKRLDDRWPAF